MDPIQRQLLADEVKRKSIPAVNPSWVGRRMGVQPQPEIGYSGAAPYAGAADVAQYGADQSYGMPWAAYQQGKTRANLSKAKPAHMYLYPMDRATPYEMDHGEMADAARDRRQPPPEPGMPPLPVQNPPYWKAMRPEDEEKYDSMVQQGLYNTNRSALASLGVRDFDRFTIDPRKNSRMSVAGLYLSHVDPKTGAPSTVDESTQKFDRAWVNAAGEKKDESGSTIAHEGMHRGIQVLRENPKYMLAANALMPKGAREEPAVRTLEASIVGTGEDDFDRKMGSQKEDDLRKLIIQTHQNPGKVGLYQKDGQWRYKNDWGFDWHHRRAALEFLAAELIKDKSPGGPR